MQTIQFQRKQNLSFNRIDDEVVLLHLEKGMYYGMDSVGSRLWELLTLPHTLETLVQAVQIEYEVDEAVCRQDVALFIETLQKNDMLEVA